LEPLERDPRARLAVRGHPRIAELGRAERRDVVPGRIRPRLLQRGYARAAPLPRALLLATPKCMPLPEQNAAPADFRVRPRIASAPDYPCASPAARIFSAAVR